MPRHDCIKRCMCPLEDPIHPYTCPTNVIALVACWLTCSIRECVFGFSVGCHWYTCAIDCHSRCSATLAIKTKLTVDLSTSGAPWPLPVSTCRCCRPASSSTTASLVIVVGVWSRSVSVLAPLASTAMLLPPLVYLSCLAICAYYCGELHQCAL